jgi:hypothetical protein
MTQISCRHMDTQSMVNSKAVSRKEKEIFLLRQVVGTYSTRISNTGVSIGDICLSVRILLVAQFCNCISWKTVTLFPKGLDMCPFVIVFSCSDGTRILSPGLQQLRE